MPPSAATELKGFTIDPSWVPTDEAGTRDGFVRVPVLIATEPGSSCTLRFSGTACGVLVNAGPDAGTLGWSIDGAPWQTFDLFTAWSGGLHLPWSHVLGAGLTADEHELRLRVEPRAAGTRGAHAARIVHFLVATAP